MMNIYKMFHVFKVLDMNAILISIPREAYSLIAQLKISSYIRVIQSHNQKHLG